MVVTNAHKRTVWGIAAAVSYLVLVAGCQGKASPIDKSNKFASILPNNGDTVEVFIIDAPDQIKEIIARMKTALTNNREWWLHYMHENITPETEGKPLPYHENFGITKEEYEQFLAGQDELVLKKVGEGNIFISMKSKGNLIINGEGIINQIKGVSINLDNEILTTPYGEAGTPKVIDAKAEMNLVGTWNGFAWRGGGYDEDRGDVKDIRFYLGKLEKEPKGFINYKVKILEGNQIIENFDIIIKYKLR